MYVRNLHTLIGRQSVLLNKYFDNWVPMCVCVCVCYACRFELHAKTLAHCYRPVCTNVDWFGTCVCNNCVQLSSIIQAHIAQHDAYMVYMSVYIKKQAKHGKILWPKNFPRYPPLATHPASLSLSLSLFLCSLSLSASIYLSLHLLISCSISVSISLAIYIYIYIYTYIYTYIYIYVCVCICTSLLSCLSHTYSYIYIYIYTILLFASLSLSPFLTCVQEWLIAPKWLLSAAVSTQTHEMIIHDTRGHGWALCMTIQVKNAPSLTTEMRICHGFTPSATSLNTYARRIPWRCRCLSRASTLDRERASSQAADMPDCGTSTIAVCAIFFA